MRNAACTLNVPSRLIHERAYWLQHAGERLAGVDEAGRGCLAGPVVAGAVEIAEGDSLRLFQGELAEVNDSKKLSPRQRERLFEIITHNPCIRWAVGSCSAQEVDQLNILRATHVAMGRALNHLPNLPAHALIDGLPVKGLPIDHTAIVKGDAQSLLIGCASIVAKVSRDRYCVEMDAHYAGYGFAQHKAYGTAFHLEALRRLGPCPEHRRSFAPVTAVQEEFPSLSFFEM